jgi:hypothetical protein
MANSRILFADTSRSTGYTVTATSSAATFPASNVLTFRPGNTWRSTNLTTNFITFSSATAIPLIGAVVLNHNLATPSGFRVDTSPDGVTWTVGPSFTVKSRTIYGHDGRVETTITRLDAYLISSLNAKYYRVRFDGTPKTGDTFWEAGRILLLTQDYPLVQDFSLGYAGGIQIMQNVTESIFGHTTSLYQGQGISLEYTLPAINATQSGIMQRICVQPDCIHFPCGTAGDMFYGKFMQNSLSDIGNGNTKGTYTFKEYI